MEKPKFMQNCKLCKSEHQFGIHKYDGKHIPKYNLDVCMTCYQANWDGWAPAHEDIILKHLKENDLPEPDRNEKGYLPRD